MAIYESGQKNDALTIKDNFDWSKELPEGKTFESLTDEEKKKLMKKYRFSGYRPGAYQLITGIGDMH